MEKPKGHGDFAETIRKLWKPSEIRAVAEQLHGLEEHEGFKALRALLDARADYLFDRLVVEKPDSVRVTDQMLGTIAGLRQATRALASMEYEANQARERAEKADAAEADESPESETP